MNVCMYVYIYIYTYIIYISCLQRCLGTFKDESLMTIRDAAPAGEYMEV